MNTFSFLSFCANYAIKCRLSRQRLQHPSMLTKRFVLFWLYKVDAQRCRLMSIKLPVFLTYIIEMLCYVNFFFLLLKLPLHLLSTRFFGCSYDFLLAQDHVLCWLNCPFKEVFNVILKWYYAVFLYVWLAFALQCPDTVSQHLRIKSWSTKMGVISYLHYFLS